MSISQILDKNWGKQEPNIWHYYFKYVSLYCMTLIIKRKTVWEE